MSAIPKCPECFALLTATLHACGRCGWKDDAPPPAVKKLEPEPPDPEGKHYIAREELRRRIKLLAAHVTRRAREISAARQVYRDEALGGFEITKGHGLRCTCELCFAWRMKPAAWREKQEAEGRALAEAQQRAEDVEELRAELEEAQREELS